MALLIKLYRDNKFFGSISVDEPIVVGRRDRTADDPPPLNIHSYEGHQRLVVADFDLNTIPRTWFEIHPQEYGDYEVRNVHASREVLPRRLPPILAGESCSYEDDVVIDLSAELVIRIEADLEPADGATYQSLSSVPLAPGAETVSISRSIQQFNQDDAQEFGKMLRLALQVVQQAAGTDAFFHDAVAATTEMVDLDRTVVMLRREFELGFQKVVESVDDEFDDWMIFAESARHNHEESVCHVHPISKTLLQNVVDTCTTVIHDPWNSTNAQSLQRVECAVASPILDRDRQVIGVLYGDRARRGGGDAAQGGISELEATFVEILAGAVAGGIARRQEEQARSTLSGFFSPQVTDRLATNPEMMDGQDATVTVLFCDIRGFSTVTEKLGPKKAIEWINDVMSDLSQCVMDRDGVLVDYVGDELLAMWGAPGEQSDHAGRAVDAARAMQVAIDRLRVRWNDILPQRFGAGIGINTGPARVGNVGSRQKFKYGPLGNTVNFGSRLQSATKQLGVGCIASQQTVEAAGAADQCRRLALLGVVGIKEPVHVYEVAQAPDDSWRDYARAYESALDDFEQSRFEQAIEGAAAIMTTRPDDLLCQKLLEQSKQQIENLSDDFTGVWRLTKK